MFRGAQDKFLRGGQGVFGDIIDRPVGNGGFIVLGKQGVEKIVRPAGRLGLLGSERNLVG
jgi:hypothetical protein